MDVTNKHKLNSKKKNAPKDQKQNYKNCNQGKSSIKVINKSTT